MAHNKERNQLFETDPEVTHILELAEKNIKTIIVFVILFF